MPYEQDYEEYGSNRRCYEQRRDNPFFTRILQEIRHLGYTSGPLLDVGCVCGFFFAQAERAGFTTWGVNISQLGASAWPVVQFCLARTWLLHRLLCAQASQAR